MKKPKRAKAPYGVPMKAVTPVSHVHISPEALCELVAAYTNNMHNNEGKSLPAYVFLVLHPDGRVSRCTNIVRPIDEIRPLLSIASEVVRWADERSAPEVFKDRGPRVEKAI